MTDNLIARCPILKDVAPQVEKAINEIIDVYKRKNKVLIAGNGGSASDAEHIAGELLKAFGRKRNIDEKLRNKLLELDKENGLFIADNLESPLEAIALTSHYSLSTAYLNDREPYLIFAQQLLAFGKEGDCFLALSTSGNSKNVCYASSLAKALGITVISMTGENGGKLAKMADIAIKVPSNETYIIQEYHLPIYHTICLEVEKYFF